jgi:hypothetical protein
MTVRTESRGAETSTIEAHGLQVPETVSTQIDGYGDVVFELDDLMTDFEADRLRWVHFDPFIHINVRDFSTDYRVTGSYFGSSRQDRRDDLQDAIDRAVSRITQLSADDLESHVESFRGWPFDYGDTVTVDWSDGDGNMEEFVGVVKGISPDPEHESPLVSICPHRDDEGRCVSQPTATLDRAYTYDAGADWLTPYLKTDLYDLPERGISHGHGTIESATITKIDGGYHVDATTAQGRQFQQYVQKVRTDFQWDLRLELHNQKVIERKEFKLSHTDLQLRDPQEKNQDDSL